MSQRAERRASVKVFPDRFTNVVSVSSRAADGSLSVDETVLFLNASWPPPFADSTKVTVFVSGQLVWGTPPA